MPMYDFKCEQGHTFDALAPVGTKKIACRECGQPAILVWISKPPATIGDACDIMQENGFKEPRHFTSKLERHRALKEAGIIEMVRHVGVPGTDKSPHTTLWSGLSAKTLADAKSMLERVAGVRASDPEEALDMAIELGEVAVPVATTSDGRTISVRMGDVYSGALDPEVLKGM